jgi:hypothetical protein
VGDPPRWPRDTPLFAKVDTTFRQQVAVAQSVYFACGLKATEFVCFVSGVTERYPRYWQDKRRLCARSSRDVWKVRRNLARSHDSWAGSYLHPSARSVEFRFLRLVRQLSKKGRSGCLRIPPRSLQHAINCRVVMAHCATVPLCPPPIRTRVSPYSNCTLTILTINCALSGWNGSETNREAKTVCWLQQAEKAEPWWPNVRQRMTSGIHEWRITCWWNERL